MYDLIGELERFIPFNQQEERDKCLLLEMLRREEELYTRDNRAAHMTASAWVLNAARDKALMVYHNIYDSWSWLGGHADGDRELLRVAVREVEEESGLVGVRPITPDIFSVEILTVDGHEKRGEYVSSHLHLNVTYLLEADDSLPLLAREGENSGVGWYSLEKAVESSSEPWFKQRIYRKLNRKLVAQGWVEGEA